VLTAITAHGLASAGVAGVELMNAVIIRGAIGEVHELSSQAEELAGRDRGKQPIGSICPPQSNGARQVGRVRPHIADSPIV